MMFVISLFGLVISELFITEENGAFDELIDGWSPSLR
jgi:hypothetical protein